MDIEDYRSNPPAPPKRGGAATKSNRPAKRSKVSSESSDPEINDGLASDLDRLDSFREGKNASTSTSAADNGAEAGNHLAHKIHVIHMLFKKRTPDPKTLSVRLVETARAIGSVIGTIPINCDWQMIDSTLGPDPLSEPLATVQATSRAFASLMAGLKKITDGVGFYLPSLIVCECVRMFKTIFDAVSESACRAAQTHSTSQFKSINTGTEAINAVKDTGPFHVICHLLDIMMSYLNKNDRHHRQIFEGLLCVLMKRIGDLLYYFTFNQHRNASIEEEITVSPAKEDNTDAECQQTEAIAIRLEARCLVMVLERAIKLAPHHMNTPLSVASTSRKSSNHVRARLQTASKVPLSAQSREKLQRTLVSCMFREEERDEFSDMLRMPATLGPIPSIPKVENGDVSDWFSGQVWRLIGWSILGSQIEF